MTNPNKIFSEPTKNLVLILVIGKNDIPLMGMGSLWNSGPSDAPHIPWWNHFDGITSEAAAEILEFSSNHGRSVDLVFKKPHLPSEEGKLKSANLRMSFFKKGAFVLALGFQPEGSSGNVNVSIPDFWENFPHPGFGLDMNQSSPKIKFWNCLATAEWKLAKEQVLGHELETLLKQTDCTHLKIFLSDESLTEVECICEPDALEALASPCEDSFTKIIKRVVVKEDDKTTFQFVWIENIKREETAANTDLNLELQAQALGIVHWNLNLFKEFQVEKSTPEEIQKSFYLLLEREPALKDFIGKLVEPSASEVTYRKVVLSNGQNVRSWSKGNCGFFAGLPLPEVFQNTQPKVA